MSADKHKKATAHKKKSRSHLSVVPSEEGLEVADREELARSGDTLDPSDPNFQSELDYDGYHSLEESDNTSYNSLDLERQPNADVELDIEDRADGEQTEEDL